MKSGWHATCSSGCVTGGLWTPGLRRLPVGKNYIPRSYYKVCHILIYQQLLCSTCCTKIKTQVIIGHGHVMHGNDSL